MNKKSSAILTGLAGLAAGGISAGRLMSRESKKWKTMSDKHLALMLLLNQWLIAKQNGKNLEDYFHSRGYKRILIYGMSYVGERLFDELRNTGVEVAAALDKNAESIFAETEVLNPDGEIPEADCIVVTPVYFYDEITKSLNGRVSCPIISLEDILYEI